MKRTLHLEVIGCNPAKVGHDYILSLNSMEPFRIGDMITVTLDKGGLSREGIIEGIKRVMGVDEDDLINGGSDAHHTNARKVYAQLRREMGLSIGDIASELKRATASVAYYLCDNSVKVKEYLEDVRDGQVR